MQQSDNSLEWIPIALPRNLFSTKARIGNGPKSKCQTWNSLFRSENLIWQQRAAETHGARASQHCQASVLIRCILLFPLFVHVNSLWLLSSRVLGLSVWSRTIRSRWHCSSVLLRWIWSWSGTIWRWCTLLILLEADIAGLLRVGWPLELWVIWWLTHDGVQRLFCEALVQLTRVSCRLIPQ